MADQKTDTNTNALAVLQQSAIQAIDDPQNLADKLREWKKVAHVLAPAVQASPFAAQHVVKVAIVALDLSTDDKGMGPDTYGLPREGRGLPWLNQGERAIGKVGLLKIANAAGISWDPDRSGRTDDRKERFYWEYKAVGKYIDFDGKEQVVIGTFEVDFRDGSPSLKGFGPAQIDAARKSGLRICESKAMNAAIRELGLRQKYTVEELKKPFVVMRVCFVPDMKDPLQRQIVAERGLSASSALYPQSRRLEAGGTYPDIDVQPERREAPLNVDTRTGEILDAPPSSTTSGPSNGNGHGGQTTRQEPPVPTGPLVVEVKSQTGVTRNRYEGGRLVSKGGKEFTRYFITLDDGRTLHTFDSRMADAADAFRKERRPVEVQTEESKFGLNLVELQPASPRLDYGDDDTPTDADLIDAGMKL